MAAELLLHHGYRSDADGGNTDNNGGNDGSDGNGFVDADFKDVE